jgi:bifunctional ADP-heptose synthase (sugar kinase/adenylyltransferase)
MRKLVGPKGHVVVLLNDDSYLLRAKGRIIVPLEQRMGLLLALRDVDMVIPFEDNDPCNMIRLAEPAYFCKGPEYATIEIPETKIIESYGGELHFVEGGPDVHTTQIIERIKAVGHPHDVEEFYPRDPEEFFPHE